MAVSVGVAVARYRLYAIERLINRTLVYAALTTVLVARLRRPYVGVGVSPAAAPNGHGGGDARRRARVPAPARARPGLVDRRFDRGRYEGLRRCDVRGRGARGRGPEEIGTVLARGAPRSARRAALLAAGERDVRGRVGRARRALPTTAARGRRSTREERAHGRPAPRPGLARAAGLAARRPGCRGALGRDRAPARRGAPAACRGQASRVRIVEAGYEERRRLERDLHDGAQQRLVSLGLQVRRHAAIAAPRSERPRSRARSRSSARSAGAIADLRQIAAGVRPARLDDGLAAALHDLARTAPIPVEVEAPIGARRGERRGGGVLRRVRGAHQRRQARVAPRASPCAHPARTARSGLDRRRRHRRGARRRGSGLAGLRGPRRGARRHARASPARGAAAPASRWRSRANRDRRRHRAAPRGARGPARGRGPRRSSRASGDAEVLAVGRRRARARSRDRRRAHAADVRGRGHAGGRRDPRSAPGDGGARPLAARRSRARRRSRRLRRRLRLPAEGPRPRRGRVPRSGGARGSGGRRSIRRSSGSSLAAQAGDDALDR